MNENDGVPSGATLKWSTAFILFVLLVTVAAVMIFDTTKAAEDKEIESEMETALLEVLNETKVDPEDFLKIFEKLGEVLDKY